MWHLFNKKVRVFSVIGMLFCWPGSAIAQPGQSVEDPGLEAPVINTSPLPAYDYDQLDYGMNMAFACTQNGRFWAGWSVGGDNADAFLILAYSDNKGMRWSKPQAVIDPHDHRLSQKRRAKNAGLWCDPLGRLWFFFDQSMDDFDGRGGTWYSVCENPDSSNPQWSAPIRIWHGQSKNKPLVLTTGEWILPVELVERYIIGRSYKDRYHELDSLRKAYAFCSTDQGKTWMRKGGVAFPNPNFNEHHFVERKDGSLWMTARTEDGIWQSFSFDKGNSWQPPTKWTEHINTRHFICRLQSGRLLLVKSGRFNERTKLRSQLTAFLSDDEGKTWVGNLVIDERRGVSYPDGFQDADGTIYISYDRNRESDGKIFMARFTEEDVLRGKINKGKSKTKILIYQPGAIERLH